MQYRTTKKTQISECMHLWLWLQNDGKHMEQGAPVSLLIAGNVFKLQNDLISTLVVPLGTALIPHRNARCFPFGTDCS